MFLNAIIELWQLVSVLQTSLFYFGCVHIYCRLRINLCYNIILPEKFFFRNQQLSIIQFQLSLGQSCVYLLPHILQFQCATQPKLNAIPSSS